MTRWWQEDDADADDAELAAGLCDASYCYNNGTCRLVETEHYSIVQCDCVAGWYGRQCEADFDVYGEQTATRTWCPVSDWGAACEKGYTFTAIGPPANDDDDLYRAVWPGAWIGPADQIE